MSFLVLAPFAAKFHFIAGAAFTDSATACYPSALTVHDSLFKHQDSPQWGNTIPSSYPFSALTQTRLNLPLKVERLLGLHVAQDGVGSDLLELLDLLRGVLFTPGTRQVEITYHPMDVYASLWLAGVDWFTGVVVINPESHRKRIQPA